MANSPHLTHPDLTDSNAQSTPYTQSTHT